LVLGELLGIDLEVFGELADDTEVSFLGALSQASQLEVLVHSAEHSGHEGFVSKRGKKDRLE
jgi:hypothetical protein